MRCIALDSQLPSRLQFAFLDSRRCNASWKRLRAEEPVEDSVAIPEPPAEIEIFAVETEPVIEPIEQGEARWRTH